MAAMIAQGFANAGEKGSTLFSAGFTVDFLTAGNTCRIFKVRKFAVDSKSK